MYLVENKKKQFRGKEIGLEDKKRIVQLFCRKKTMKQIVKLTGISDYMVYKVVHNFNKSRSNSWVVTERQESLVVKMYEAKYSGIKIAKHFNVTEDTIYRILKRNNVERRPFNYYRKYNFDERFFETIDSEKKAYWLGFLLADGCIKEDRQVMLRLSSVDKNHLVKFQKDLKSSYPYYYEKKSNTVGVTLGSQKTCKDLANYGCVTNKTFKLYYPEIPKILKRHFIRGYFDGDGSFYFNPLNKRVTFDICGKYEFLDKMQDDIILFLGLNKTKLIKTRSIYALKYGGRIQNLKILNWLYKDSTIYLDRKHQRYLSFKESMELN